MEIEVGRKGLIAIVEDSKECFKLKLLKDESLLGRLFLCKQENNSLENNSLEIDKFYVTEKKKGYATALINASKKVALKNNYDKIYARILPGSENFWKKNNFKIQLDDTGLDLYACDIK